jgi:hypothetical protein
MRVPAETAPDLAVLRMEVLDLPEFHPTWTRPIVLLIPCAGAHSFLSDASYGGLKGWLPEFAVMWRMMRECLLPFGFHEGH